MPGFRDIVGQEQIKMHLQQAIAGNKLSHAYIISGERYSGKEFLASILAQTIQCEEGGTEPCGSCKSCIQAMNKSHPDIIRINHDKPSSIGVNDIREQLVNDVNIRPYDSRYRVFIVNEAELLTIEAQNAMLKTLEEPPEYAVLLLLTTNTGAFLPTVLSRCITLEMKPVPSDMVRDYLVTKMGIDIIKADTCVAFACGNLGKAKQLAESEDFDRIRSEAVYLMKTMDPDDPECLAAALKKVGEYKLDISDFLDIIAIWYRDVLIFKATNDVNSLIFRDEIQSIKKSALINDYVGIENILNALEVAKRRLSANVNFELTIRLLLLVIKDAME